MAKDLSRPSPNRTLQRILDRSNGDEVVEVRGYVAESAEGTISLFPRLSASTRIDVSADDVVHVLESTDDREPATLYVRAAATVSVTRSTPMRLNARALARGAVSAARGCGCGTRPGAPKSAGRPRMIDDDGGGRLGWDCRKGCLAQLFGCLNDPSRSADECFYEADFCEFICDLGTGYFTGGGRFA